MAISLGDEDLDMEEEQPQQQQPLSPRLQRQLEPAPEAKEKERDHKRPAAEVEQRRDDDAMEHNHTDDDDEDAASSSSSSSSSQSEYLPLLRRPPQQRGHVLSAEDDVVLALNKAAGLGSRAGSRPPAVQLDFAGAFDARLSMPDALQSLVCDFLQRADLRNLKHASRGAHHFVRSKYPRLSQRHRKHKHRKPGSPSAGNSDSSARSAAASLTNRLTAFQRLDLALMRFYDRPVYQRVLIGIACVPIVPFVVLWHTPKAVRFLHRHAVVPLAKTAHACVLRPVWRAGVALVKHCVIAPARFTARKTTQYILEPGLRAADWVGERLLLPVAKRIVWSARFTYRRVLTPLGHGAARVASATRNGALCVGGQVKQRVLLPLARAARSLAHFGYQNLVVPVGRGISTAAREAKIVLRSCARTLGDWGMVVLRQLHRWVLRPLWMVLVLFWCWLVWPVLRFMWHVIRFVSEDIIWKLLSSLASLARALLVDVLYAGAILPAALALYHAVLLPLGLLVVALGSAVLDAATAVAHAIATMAMLVAVPVMEMGAVIGRLFGSGA